MALRLGILTTHPIQYQVPWFRALAAKGELVPTIFYAMIPDRGQQGVGFDVAFEWDLPLLGGYEHVVLENVSRAPSLATFGGCDTPGIDARVRAGGFDAFVVHGWGTRSALQALWACRRHGVPCIVRGESNLLRRRPLVIRAAHRILLRQYAACLTIGRSNEAFYRAHGVPAARLFHAPYGVDNERFARQTAALVAERPALRAAWGIADRAFVFAFCGKLVEKKRPFDLIEAFGRATRHGAPAHLLMVGDGALRAECAARTRRDRLPVTFTGFLNQQEVAKAYAAADCLVLPSDYGETWGLVVNEAMACGRPAVVSDRVGCHEDLVENGVTGAVFPFGDVVALSAVLAELAERPAYAAAFGAAARERVARYSIDAAVAGTLAAARFVAAGS